MDYAHLEHLLFNIFPFDLLTEAERTSLLSRQTVRMQTFTRGELIHLQHEVCQNLDVILDGSVSVQHIDLEGNSLFIRELQAGELLGANLLFASRNLYPMTVSAEQRAVIASLKPADILNCCQRNAAFMRGVMQVISDRSIVLTDKIQALAVKSIRQTLLDYFQYESKRQQSQTIRLPLSKKSLAERLGIQRTSLSREMQKMRQEGLINFDVHTVTLLG